ncbi:MAG: type II toxin-antitoxin system HicB family antitoxin [Candidatus Sumerlaeaceae bacterium]
MKHYLFQVVVEDDEMEDGRKAYSVHVPQLPGCNTFGLSYDEAIANAREAVELYVQSLLEHGDPIPGEPLEDAQYQAVALTAPSVLVNV